MSVTTNHSKRKLLLKNNVFNRSTPSIYIYINNGNQWQTSKYQGTYRTILKYRYWLFRIGKIPIYRNYGSNLDIFGFIEVLAVFNELKLLLRLKLFLIGHLIQYDIK